MNFSDSIWKDCPDTGRSTGSYIIFYQGGPIDHGTHVPGSVAQSSAENMSPKEAPLIVLDSKYAMCMAKNSKDNKHTRQIARRMHFVRNGEK